MSQETKKQQESYNTTDLASELSKKFGLSKSQALKIVTATFTLIGNAVARDAIVRVHQFGNFKRLETKERQGRNPKTGEITTIEASARPHFVAAQSLKAKVKSGEQESVDAAISESAAEGTTATAAPAPAKPAARPAQAARKPLPRKPAPAPAPAPEEAPEPAADGSAIDEL